MQWDDSGDESQVDNVATVMDDYARNPPMFRQPTTVEPTTVHSSLPTVDREKTPLPITGSKSTSAATTNVLSMRELEPVARPKPAPTSTPSSTSKSNTTVTSPTPAHRWKQPSTVAWMPKQQPKPATSSSSTSTRNTSPSIQMPADRPSEKGTGSADTVKATLTDNTSPKPAVGGLGGKTGSSSSGGSGTPGGSSSNANNGPIQITGTLTLKGLQEALVNMTSREGAGSVPVLVTPFTS